MYQDKKGHFTNEENDGGECQHETMKNGKSKTNYIPIAHNPNELMQYVRMVLNGENAPERIVVSNISERTRKKIETLTGEQLNAQYHTISQSEIKHIEKRHGTNGKADSSMREIEAYGKIPDVLNNFDDIELIIENNQIQRAKVYLDKHKERAKLVRFKKKYKSNEMVVVEAVTDTKRGNIVIISARQIKKDGYPSFN